MKIVYTYALGEADCDCLEVPAEDLAHMRLPTGACLSAAELAMALACLHDDTLQELITTLSAYSRGAIRVVTQGQCEV